MNQHISVYELMNLYLNHNADQKTSPEYILKLQNQYKTTFFFPTVMLFLPHYQPHTKFHPNRTKNTEVRNFHFWSILVGRAGRSKNGRSHFKHSESLERLTKDLCTKFEPNRTKIGKVSPLWNFFPKIEIWLVGPVCVSEIGSRIRIHSR